jgi:hypothetical protein
MVLQMAAPVWLSRPADWIFRTSALREVRREIAEFGEARVRAAAQARLSLEIARRVAESTESLPKGSRPAALIGLYRDALTWALASEQRGLERVPEFKALWARVEPSRKLQLAGDALALASAERFLLAESASDWLGASDAEAATIRRIAERVVSELDRLGQRFDLLRTQRLVSALVLLVVAASLAMAVWTSQGGRDLALGKPFVASSSSASCVQPAKCEGLLFHTQEERNPWVEFDLGSVVSVRRVEVRNRKDCCGERAVPLVVELSTDRQRYSEVARANDAFSEWVAKFSAQKARYVRLRVPRKSILHLEAVAVR